MFGFIVNDLLELRERMKKLLEKCFIAGQKKSILNNHVNGNLKKVTCVSILYPKRF